MKTLRPGTGLMIALALAIAGVAVQSWIGQPPAGDAVSGGGVIEQAFEAGHSGIIVSGEGRVERVLPDDDDGSRHQRFVVRLESGLTVLVAHNIDVAPRVSGLRAGDRVRFRGEYEWNDRGGVVHWTHRDERGTHEHGWLQHEGRIYE